MNTLRAPQNDNPAAPPRQPEAPPPPAPTPGGRPPAARPPRPATARDGRRGGGWHGTAAHLPGPRWGRPGGRGADGGRGRRAPAGVRPRAGAQGQPPRRGRGGGLAHRAAYHRQRRGQAADPGGQRRGRQQLRDQAAAAEPWPGAGPVGRGDGQGPVRRLGRRPVRLRPRRGRGRRGRGRRGRGRGRARRRGGRLVPLREDLRSVLVIGSGPIVIGQAAEFDYSGTQACRALRRLGLRVILVNSNPATIMTDPEVADATYLEPLTPDMVAAVIEAERPEAVLPTLGGQTALNLAVALDERGDLERLGV